MKTFDEVIQAFVDAGIDVQRLYWSGAEDVDFVLIDEEGNKSRVARVEAFIPAEHADDPRWIETIFVHIEQYESAPAWFGNPNWQSEPEPELKSFQEQKAEHEAGTWVDPVTDEERKATLGPVDP